MERFGLSGGAAAGRAQQPVVLTVPGLNNSGPGHWQTIWEERRGDCRRVDLGSWSSPSRNAWVNRLDTAIRETAHAHGAPIILAAHSLGCLAVAWWGALQSQPYGWPVAGALLVAPPDCERTETPETIGGFAPVPRSALPFPSILVASRNDPYIFYERAHSIGKNWGSQIIDAGHSGHINAQSGLGEWRFGQALLDRLIALADDHGPLGQQRGGPALTVPSTPHHPPHGLFR
ncbi:RBBP9/YdeN family alpha/beta hydrolase [Sphingobium algorifonticola]|uniref:Alpha/beta hydrolase n=1 Tax=Sphingobium algorifonticola TaxID=2008318 RepID=A0A437JCP5_9SPHN|nr:alpha/beta hydrolase [Sphingobium algorifonticola]RVT43520.1 alpha/beta hydrolase [Sphingobium algorifonticola]